MRHWLQAMAFGVAAVMVTAPVKAETLADAFIAAYKNSNLLDQQRATLRATDEGVAQSVARLRPTIAFIGGWTSTWRKTRVHHQDWSDLNKSLNISAKLTADLTLMDFGRTQYAIDVAEQTVLATRQALVNVEQQVLYAAVDAYVNVRLAHEIVALRESNVNLIGQELSAAQDRFEVGEITRTDVAMTEAELAGARANLAAAEGQLLIAREAYKAATGAYPGQLAAPPKAPATAASLAAATDVARKAHPAILQAQHMVTASDKQVLIAEANFKPTVGVGASLGHGHNRPSYDLNNSSFEASLGLTLRQDLYTGGATSSVYRQAIANKEGTRAQLRQTVVLVEQNVGNAWANRSVYDASIVATDRQIIAAKEAFDGVREEANLGARTTLDVLDSEQDLLDARTARLEAEAGRYLASYQILQSMGLLTVDHLQLGIPTYDTKAYYDAVRNAPATSSRGRKLDAIMGKVAN